MKMNRLRAFGAAVALFLAIGWPLLAANVPPRPAALRAGGFPGGQIRLSWTHQAPNESYFRLERSKNKPNNYTFLADLPANTTVYTDTTVRLDTTYWYRVQACNQAGCSLPSKDSYSVSFAAETLPNQDERYMAFLVNEARADPAAYGYPVYPPRPPLAGNPLLTYAAHAHAQAVVNSGFTISHCHPASNDGSTEYRCPSERARDVGYPCAVSENMVRGSGGWEGVEAAHRLFIDSPAHRENMLDSAAQEVGMGYAYDLDKSATFPGQYVQTFCGLDPALPQALPAGVVVPYWGRATTSFTFLANFYNPAGTKPQQALVIIDGQAYKMELRHGVPANGSYAYTTTLDRGPHTYFFRFKYGEGQDARLPAAGVYTGPDVEVGQAVLEAPDEYPTLAAALAEAKGDVIIQLAAGTFAEKTPLILNLPGIQIRGAGLDKTIIQGRGSGHVFEVEAAATLRGLTLTGSGSQTFDSALWHTRGQLKVHQVRVTGNNRGLFTYCFTPGCKAIAKISNSIFDHNAGAALEANAPGRHQLLNLTIASNGRGVVLNHLASRVVNSIIVGNTNEGLAGPAQKFPYVRYNNVWDNGKNYEGLEPGDHNISRPPRFEAETQGDYRLEVGSLCINAGHPAAQYDDRDGSRNDLGAYGGPQAPVSLNSQVSVTPREEQAYIVSWQGYASEGVQSYDIQYRLGYDGSWQDWLSQTTATSALFGPAEPVIVPGEGVYYFRSRVRDASGNIEAYPVEADAYTGLEVISVYLPIIQK